MFRKGILVFFILLVSLYADSYSFEPELSRLSFSVPYLNHLIIHGRFEEASGTLKADADLLTSIVMKVDVDSLCIGSDKTKEFVLGPSFLNAKKHKRIYFKSLRIVRDGDKTIMNGLFDINGVTKKIDFPIVVTPFEVGEDRYISVYAEPVLDRRVFEINSEDQTDSDIGLAVTLDTELVFKLK